MIRKRHETRLANVRPVLWLVGLLSSAVVLLGLGGEHVRQLFRYERLAVLEHDQLWRLLTGHLVHGNWRHLALNLAGLTVLCALFPRHYSMPRWGFIGVLSVLAIDVGFVWREPQLAWYVGLSGVLHGVLAAGAVAWWRYESRLLALALTAILVGKLAWEQSQGSLPFSGDMPVIVDAHLYGALGGLIAAVSILISDRRWSGEARSL